MITPSHLHLRAPDGQWHYSVSYQWRGDRGDGGMDALYFSSEMPLSSVPAMEHLLLAIRQRHAQCRHVVILHLWPLEHGGALPDHRPSPLDGEPPTTAVN